MFKVKKRPPIKPKEVNPLIIMRTENTTNELQKFVNTCLFNKENVTGVEIGSYSGESSLIFINSGRFKTLFCIDPWVNGYDPNDPASLSNHKAEKVFDANTRNYKNIVKIKDYSYNVHTRFEDDSIDFLYIDGCHTYEGVKTDLELYFKKVKKGGIVGGHDFYLNSESWSGVKKAILEFFKNEYPCEVFEDGSWYYIKNENSITTNTF